MTVSDAHLAVYHRAYSLLSQFVDPQRVAERLRLLLTLQPQSDDYGEVFAADVVELARVAYTALASPQPLHLTPEQTLVELQVATGQELQGGTGAAREFPWGYAAIPHLLHPERYRICWRFGAPHQRGPIFYYGLVAVAGRFVWLPKPWRCLPARKHSAFAVASHFDD